jgi:glycosyltransferase involved in cell wall biosynthesis
MFKYLSNIGINESKIEIIPPPIDIDFYKPLNREKLLLKYEIPHDKTIILYHGRTATVRGLMMFLNTLKDLKNEKNLFAVLSLADLDDEDMSVNDVEDYIQKEGLENITKRFIGKNNPLEMYNLADIVVFPFLTAGAAICPPLSVLEAMSCGKVVVTSNIEELGLNYIIKNNQNGFLINPTEKDLIKCIKDLKFKDDNNLKKIEFNARASIEKSYSIKVVAEKILTISEELC